MSEPRESMGFWPDAGFAQLGRNSQGWLTPTDEWLRTFLDRPELALVNESCRGEQRLHRALRLAPSRPVAPAELQALRDSDARENYQLFLRLRDGLLSAGTLEGWYLALFRGGRIDIPPVFIDAVAQAIIRNALDGCTDAMQVRAAELLFRPQRITLQDGRVLAGDQATLDMDHETQGLGELGRLLAQAKAPLRPLQIRILSDEPEETRRFWAEATQSGTRQTFLLDLTLELQRDLGHGVSFTLAHARSGLKALAAVLQTWIHHLLGVVVTVEPLPRIDDAQWRWHIGLDAEATALLNDLYEGNPVEPDRLARLVGLFRLTFDDPADMRADVAGKPVYLGLVMTPERLLRMKPQNLLVNLPLAAHADRQA